MEKEDFSYKEVPKNYTHCLNEQCLRSPDCLRYRVALRADRRTHIFMTVNPRFVANKEECPYFQPDTLTRFALGITHLFDNVPHKKMPAVKGVIYKHFKRNMYYLIFNKQRAIKPEDQAFIRKVFMDEGIEEEPVFDEYIDKYDW